MRKKKRKTLSEKLQEKMSNTGPVKSPAQSRLSLRARFVNSPHAVIMGFKPEDLVMKITRLPFKPVDPTATNTTFITTNTPCIYENNHNFFYDIINREIIWSNCLYRITNLPEIFCNICRTTMYDEKTITEIETEISRITSRLERKWELVSSLSGVGNSLIRLPSIEGKIITNEI